MSEDIPAASPGYRIWAADDVVYGPVDLPVLVDWVGDERVLAATWVFLEASRTWARAGEVAELQALFGQESPATPDPAVAGQLVPGIKPGSLRRVKIFAAMTDTQLGRFAQLMEVVKVSSFKEVVKQGGPGDAMYAVLEGELRARMLVGGRETTLATFQPGDVFGEITLFDDGPRSADVLANVDSTLLTSCARSSPTSPLRCFCRWARPSPAASATTTSGLAMWSPSPAPATDARAPPGRAPAPA
jgi:Cyclic nucleotide-binding domain